MYVMVETMRIEDDSDSDELKKARELFRAELSEWHHQCLDIMTVLREVLYKFSFFGCFGSLCWSAEIPAACDRFPRGSEP